MNNQAKRLVILGSTGSIGRQTLDIVRAMPESFRVVGLAAGNNTELLAEQVREFKPEVISCASTNRSILNDTGSEFITLEEMARYPAADIVVMAISGTAGLKPTLAAVQAGKRVALANKESLVAAGEILIAEAQKSGARILPVDSEHSAIWQCLNGEKQKPRKLILTASGGPFRNYPASKMESVTVAQALKHPSWQMGKKVTIDSATLMNKGLEIIEARWLFDMPVDDITVLVHPQSIIHSMVEFIDGSIKAQLSHPDMRLPIQYALTFPGRLANSELPCLDWGKIDGLTFEQPDYDKFPCLNLAVAAGKEGDTSPAVLCSADETAVELFLSGRIRFTEIAVLISRVLERHRKIAHPSIEAVIEAGAWAGAEVLRLADGEN